jgi:hypothetical protein
LLLAAYLAGFQSAAMTAFFRYLTLTGFAPVLKLLLSIACNAGQIRFLFTAATFLFVHTSSRKRY